MHFPILTILLYLLPLIGSQGVPPNADSDFIKSQLGNRLTVQSSNPQENVISPLAATNLSATVTQPEANGGTLTARQVLGDRSFNYDDSQLNEPSQHAVDRFSTPEAGTRPGVDQTAQAGTANQQSTSNELNQVIKNDASNQGGDVKNDHDDQSGNNDDKNIDDKSIDDKNIDDKSIDDKSIDDKSIDDKNIDDNNASDDNDSADGRAAKSDDQKDVDDDDVDDGEDEDEADNGDGDGDDDDVNDNDDDVDDDDDDDDDNNNDDDDDDDDIHADDSSASSDEGDAADDDDGVDGDDDAKDP